MKKISSIVTNYDTATSGFSEGKLRDNPGDDTGSSVVAALGNDWYYALAAVVKAQNSLGAVSDNPESESNHDFLDALLEMVGQKVNGVADWSAATTYSTANTHVMRRGFSLLMSIRQETLTKIRSRRLDSGCRVLMCVPCSLHGRMGRFWPVVLLRCTITTMRCTGSTFP